MERVHHHPSISNPKMERRIIEKNRRNYMKTLYSNLYSLLPSYNSKEVLAVPDQIDEAKNHIESLEKKLEMYKEKKEKLLYGKRPYSSCSSSGTSKGSKITNVEIHEMGPQVDVIFISGLQEQSSFYDIIRRLCEEGFEVLNANFSNNGNSTLQIGYDKGGKSTWRAESAAVSKRLKELIYGYSQGEIESRLDLWDYEIEPEILSSEILELIPRGEFCFVQQL